MAVLVKPMCPKCGKEDGVTARTDTFEIEELKARASLPAEMKIVILSCGYCNHLWRLPGSVIEERG